MAFGTRIPGFDSSVLRTSSLLSRCSPRTIPKEDQLLVRSSFVKGPPPLIRVHFPFHSFNFPIAPNRNIATRAFVVGLKCSGKTLLRSSISTPGLDTLQVVCTYKAPTRVTCSIYAGSRLRSRSSTSTEYGAVADLIKRHLQPI
jgi:hypothetical protein